MAGGVEVEVRSQLEKLVKDLEAIQKAGREVTNNLKSTGATLGEETDKQTKQVKTMFENLQDFSRRVAKNIGNDFKAMASLASLGSGLKLSSQFAGSIKDTVTLSDTVRRLGPIFGIAKSEFNGFQSALSRGFGEIGASSQAAANAINGLSQTGVRGQDNLVAYAKTAAMLSSITGQKGNEGEVARGTAEVVAARGGNVNDLKQMRSVQDEILRIHNTVGGSATDIAKSLTGLYQGTNQAFQSRLANGGATTLAAAELRAPGASAFIEQYLGKGQFENAGAKARGFGNILGTNGEINTKQVQSLLQQAKGYGQGDVQQGLTMAFGMSKEEAQGFMRLGEALRTSGNEINGAHRAVVNINSEFKQTRGLGDSFRASVNKVKGFAAPAIGYVTQGATELLGNASQSTAGSVAVTAGAGLLSAVLAGGGLRGIGNLLGGEAKAKAIEAATGEHVQKVEVINFPSGFGGVAPAAGGVLSGVAGFLGKASLVGTAAVAGYEAGGALNKLYQGAVENNTGGLGDADKRIQAVFDLMFQKLSGFQPAQGRVTFEKGPPGLKATVKPVRSSH